MKLRLQVELPNGGSSFVFEHGGPAVRIGRDPAGDLSLGGDTNLGVSWQHARIDLAPRGATLTDLGSSNGTLLNGERLARPADLKVGDQVRLGYTGPALTVLELDLSVPAPPPPPTRLEAPAPVPVVAPVRRPEPRPAPLPPTVVTPPRTGLPILPIAATAAAVGALLLVLAVILLKRPGGPPEGTSAETTAVTHREVVVAPTPTTPAPPTNPPATTGPAQPLPPIVPPPAVNLPPVANIGDRRDLGRFAATTKAPNVLLERPGPEALWGPLRPEARVSSSDHLVSLPGYRSRVDLDSGVLLTLWGNVPEFSATPPVLESAVLLLSPGPGFDLDVSLDRGRIHLANRKQAGPVKVRTRFQSETWDVTLPSAASEAVLELWWPSPQYPAGQTTPCVATLYARGGPVHLDVSGRPFELKDRDKVSWASDTRTPKGPEPAADPPWWTDKLDPNAVTDKEARARLEEVMLALKDWHDKLTRPAEGGRVQAVIDTIQTQLNESPDPAVRRLAPLFLIALDEAKLVADYLNYTNEYERGAAGEVLRGSAAEIRGTAAFALRGWLARDPSHAQELEEYLEKQRKWAPENAKVVVSLLHTLPPAALKDPKTYQTLIELLSHDKLEVRELARWHLETLVPAGRGKFDPSAPAEQRQAGIAEWQKLIPRGTLPKQAGQQGG